MTTITYSCIARDKNSWGTTGEHAITWHCGHTHRSALAAYRCLLSMGDSCCAYHATVEASSGQHPDMTDLAAEVAR